MFLLGVQRPQSMVVSGEPTHSFPAVHIFWVKQACTVGMKWIHSTSSGLPGAEVGRNGKDTSQSRDDTAHVGQEREVVFVSGFYLHG